MTNDALGVAKVMHQQGIDKAPGAPPPCSSPFLPSRGGISAVLLASFVGASTMPSGFCKQLGSWGDSIMATNLSDTGLNFVDEVRPAKAAKVFTP